MLGGVCCSAILFLALALKASAADPLQERTFPIPGRGLLVISSPSAWAQQIGQPPDEIAPTIRFSSAAGQKFEVAIAAFWSPTDDLSFNSSAKVRSIVEDTLVEIKPRLVERDIPILELHRGSRTGFFISATVKAPGPGEYKYLTQGVIGVEDLLLTFTVLTNEKPSPIINHALDMLRSAKRGT